FLREVNLLSGVALSGGDALEKRISLMYGFNYFRAFSKPQSGHFTLRMIADTLVTPFTFSSAPLPGFEGGKEARAILVRFGFSGCYVGENMWLACMDDGPRIGWVKQGTSNAQVLGNFPLGVSLHSGAFHPMSLHARAEFGSWNVRLNGKEQKSHMNFYTLGAGYSW
ncbi:MAG: hypothetical protein RIR26_735, partial [Pseudomonadota bacterium]